MFDNPYKDLPTESMSRINANVPAEDYKMVQRIRTGRGTIQTTINILWSKFINELKRLGITDYSRADEFEKFVASIELRSAFNGPREQTNVADDRRGVEGAGHPDTTTTNKPSDDAGRNTRRRVERRRKESHRPAKAQGRI